MRVLLPHYSSAYAKNGFQYDEDVPVDTARAWVLGMLLTTIASGLNALFALRQPAITITSLTVQLVAYPLGVGWTYAMPTRKFSLFGKSFTLNNGPFNMKEHTIIVVMANVNVAGMTSAPRKSAISAAEAHVFQVVWHMPPIPSQRKEDFTDRTSDGGSTFYFA